MQASEGKVGRVFFLSFDESEGFVDCIESFAREKGIGTAQVFLLSRTDPYGIVTLDEGGTPRLIFCGPIPTQGSVTGAVLQEVIGIHLHRVKDPESGRDILERVPTSKTRVLEKPAPAPVEEGPGTIPVYLFNADFN